MSIPLTDPERLWSLPPDSFNDWRSKNDLPLIFEAFLENMPGFGDWSLQNGIDSAIFCRTVPTAGLLLGARQRLLIAPSDHEAHQPFYSTSEVPPEVSLRKIPPNTKSFIPYFLWAKRTLGIARLAGNDNFTAGTPESLTYSPYLAFTPDTCSRATLFRDFSVLKLGGVSLHSGIRLDGRNLDFVDLDHLTINGFQFLNSGHVYAHFSSCHYLRLEETNLAFLNFHYCAIGGLRCAASRLQTFEFAHCTLADAQFKNSELVRVRFVQSALEADFAHCNLVEVEYSPGRWGWGWLSTAPPTYRHWPSAVAATYRQFRAAYQASGKGREASECYYRERQYERRVLQYPYSIYRDQFRLNRKYSGTVANVIRFWRMKHFTTRQSLRFALSVLWFHIRVWLWPRYAARALRFKVRYLASVVEELIWGYGERPIRSLFTALTTVAAFGAYFHSLLKTHSVLGCIYFSVVTFTTLGNGDITPQTPLTKFLCGTEALLGVFLLGLFVAGFANRNRY